MTDPDASADNQQLGVIEPALPDSAGIPQTEVAANPLHDPADASLQPISTYQDVPGCESVSRIAGQRLQVRHRARIPGQADLRAGTVP
jgi:hypothetical protein